jgi:hypothetical protein
MPTKQTSKTKSSTKKAVTGKSSSAKKQAAMIIKLTTKQRAQLKKLSKGTVDAQTIQIRGDLDVGQFLGKVGELAARRPAGTKAGFAPPPKDSYWC